MTGRHRDPKRKLQAGYRVPSRHVIIIFHRRVCFVCAMHVFEVRSSCSSPGNFVPNFVSFAASIAELAHGEKLHTVTQSISLFDALGTEACASEFLARELSLVVGMASGWYHRWQQGLLTSRLTKRK